MKVAGEAVVAAPVEQVWQALLDPQVLVRTIPGCQRLETRGDHAYDMTVEAGVAAVRGTYAGTCELHDLVPHDSMRLKAQGAGPPGTIAADVRLDLTDNGDGTTGLRYDADAIVGGMIGGVGQRMLTSAGKRVAGEFFGNVEQVLTAAPAAEAPPAVAVSRPGGVFEAPPRARSSEPGEFVKGLVVGGGLVLLGVLAGAAAARRRG